MIPGQLLGEDFVRLGVRYIAIMENIDTAKGVSDIVSIQDLDKARKITRLTEDRVGKGLEIAEQIRQRGEIPWLTGTGADGLLSFCTGTETLAWMAQGCYQNAAAAALCAWQMAEKGQLTDCHGLKPVYLRLSQAEQMKQKKEANQKG